MAGDGLYLHIRVVLGIVLGLGITTLLRGIASIIEHPRRYHWSWIHMSWVAWALVTVVTFWWWEYRLLAVPRWTFESYLFVITYCSSFYVLAVLLFPSDVSEYGSYEAYLLHRRPWFFGLIVLMTLMDLVDTSLKGTERWQALGTAYPIHTATILAIAVLGIALKGRGAQLAIALVALAYQVAYLGLQYFTLTTA
jgi:hypothetical protein